MKKSMKLAPCMWIAHDSTTCEVVPKTMRHSLTDTKAAYIWQKVLPSDIVDQITLNQLKTGVKPLSSELVDGFEDLIPEEIKFIIVRLQPDWSTEI